MSEYTSCYLGYDLSKRNLKDFSIDFSTKMCINSVIVYMIKGNNDSISSNPTVNSTKHSTSHFTVFSNYSTEHCGYAHQNTLGYCGESSMDDCRKCNWRGCSLIECGNEVNKRFV